MSAIGEWWEKVGVGDDSNSAGTTTAAGGVELRLWLREHGAGTKAGRGKGRGWDNGNYHKATRLNPRRPSPQSPQLARNHISQHSLRLLRGHV